MGNAKAVIRLIAASNPYLPQPIAPFLGRGAVPQDEEGSSPDLSFL